MTHKLVEVSRVFLELTHKDGDRYIQQYRAGDDIFLNKDVPNPVEKVKVMFIYTEMLMERV